MTEDRRATSTDPDLVRRLFEAQPDGLWVLRRRGHHDLRQRQHGPAPRTATCRRWWACRSPRSSTSRAVATSASTLPEMIASGEGQENLDAYFRRPDGTSVWGLVSNAPVLDDDGRRTGWLHRVTPYTDRKELVESARRARAAARDRPADRPHRQLGVGPRRGPGRVVRRAVPDLRRRARHPGDVRVLPRADPPRRPARRRPHRAGRSRRRPSASTPSTTGSSAPDGEVRWVRGRGFIERAPDGDAAPDERHRPGHHRHREGRRARPPRRPGASHLLEQMATAANRATTLREAILLAGVRRTGVHVVGGGVRLRVRRRRTAVRADRPRRHRRGGPGPGLGRARPGRRRGGARAALAPRGHPQPGRDAGARARRGGLRGPAARRRGAAGRAAPTG